ncbi:PP2C family protein-serine/threonine phosphatase [Streptomyces tropicalis]|uniref:PP2C family protein-serine/threonine phosphatase n=1 Tax=Streptomyces tropicalis TaxID=3034234 RepID=A0ABT6A368_9ACTN|nr:PP2C family protein-serine/threonine phosphatase [Streptomyces tropicalis]MDF3299096.1 PP2C family protein-serine/threonine phosphatase [Streptomyces tropicalis]
MLRSRRAPDPVRTAGPTNRSAPALSWAAVWFWLVAVTVVLAVTGVVLGRETRLAPFLIVLPALLAGRGSVRQTTVASVWVTVVIAGSLLDTPMDTPGADAAVLVFAVVFNALSIARAAQRVGKEREIARLRSAAAALQRQLLRPFPLLTDELLVHGLYQPVEEDSRVGGDVYEVVSSPYGSRVFIADVQGKGLPAIGAAFAVLSAFREAAIAEPTLTGVVDALEEAVLRHNSFAAQSGDRERFVTALVLSVGPDREVQAVNCGHVPPLLLNGADTGSVLGGEACVPLGLEALAPAPRTVEWFSFPPGSTLLLCTDGVTEARAPSGAFYPLEQRARTWSDVTPADLPGTLYHGLRRHTAGTAGDDTAVLVLRRVHPTW